MKRTIVFALLLSACAQDRRVGDLPDGSNPSGQAKVQLQNVVATVIDAYACPAGRLSPYDDVTSCNCDSVPFACDNAQIGTCLCDPDCIDQRPMIDCADYAITLTLANRTPSAVDRLTSVSVTVGEHTERRAGLTCQAWSLLPGETTPVMQITFRYDRGRGGPYAEPDLDFECNSWGTPKQPSEGSGGRDLGKPLPPAITTGAVLLELEGLLSDGAPWEVAASAEL